MTEYQCRNYLQHRESKANYHWLVPAMVQLTPADEDIEGPRLTEVLNSCGPLSEYDLALLLVAGFHIRLVDGTYIIVSCPHCPQAEMVRKLGVMKLSRLLGIELPENFDDLVVHMSAFIG